MILSFQKIMRYICFVFDVPELPPACPVCGSRNSVVPSVQRWDDRELLCTKCEVMFSKNKPQEYRYTPKRRYEIVKAEILKE